MIQTALVPCYSPHSASKAPDLDLLNRALGSGTVRLTGVKDRRYWEKSPIYHHALHFHHSMGPSIRCG